MSKKIKNRQNNCGFISSVHFPLSMDVIYDLKWGRESNGIGSRQSVTVKVVAWVFYVIEVAWNFFEECFAKNFLTKYSKHFKNIFAHFSSFSFYSSRA